MNVLDVAFDCKLNWQIHKENTITKAKKALNANKLIYKYFDKNELLNLITSKTTPKLDISLQTPTILKSISCLHQHFL